MRYKYIRSTRLLNKISEEDHLFSGDYTLDPYKNCEFGCKYCDSSFDDTVYIKTNAKEVFEKELQNLKNGTIIIGSVHDPYQKIERNTCITRDILDIIKKNDLNCHILTKSDLVLRDINILSEIENCRVTLSITSLDDNITKIFERNVPETRDRLEVVRKLKKNGVESGVALLPVLPLFIEKELENIVKKVKEYNANYLISKYLELKGDQKNIFFDILKEYFPNFLSKYKELYNNSYIPNEGYIKIINEKITDYCKKYRLLTLI